MKQRKLWKCLENSIVNKETGEVFYTSKEDVKKIKMYDNSYYEL